MTKHGDLAKSMVLLRVDDALVNSDSTLWIHEPAVKSSHQLATPRKSIKKPYKVCKQHLPSTQFALVHKVNNEHAKWVEAEQHKLLGKLILGELISANHKSWRTVCAYDGGYPGTLSKGIFNLWTEYSVSPPVDKLACFVDFRCSVHSKCSYMIFHVLK